jgi:NADPH-dependent 2,4-dienoyl-CoA reductase/sulfur reductase-like enzyme
LQAADTLLTERKLEMDNLSTLSGEATALVDASPPPGRKRVVIVGGGFAGLAAVHALRHADAEG